MSDLTPSQEERLKSIREKHGRGDTTTRESTQNDRDSGETEGATTGAQHESSGSTDGETDPVSQRRNGQIQGSVSDIGTHGSIHFEDGRASTESDGGSSSARKDHADTADNYSGAVAEERVNDDRDKTDTSANQAHTLHFQPVGGKKRGRPRKVKAVEQLTENAKRFTEDIKEAVKFTPETARKLTQKEIDEIGEDFKESLQLYFALMDDAIAAITKGHENPQIWVLSDEEAEILGSMWLDMGKADVKVAHSVRVMVNLKVKFAACTIVASRCFATMDYVWNTGLAVPTGRKKRVVNALPNW